jgi:hypothetical protein
MFKAVNVCITTEVISWSYCVDFCTDRAVALTGHKRGFQVQLSHVGPQINIASFIERL